MCRIVLPSSLQREMVYDTDCGCAEALRSKCANDLSVGQIRPNGERNLHRGVPLRLVLFAFSCGVRVAALASLSGRCDRIVWPLQQSSRCFMPSEHVNDVAHLHQVADNGHGARHIRVHVKARFTSCKELRVNDDVGRILEVTRRIVRALDVHLVESCIGSVQPTANARHTAS